MSPVKRVLKFITHQVCSGFLLKYARPLGPKQEFFIWAVKIRCNPPNNCPDGTLITGWALEAYYCGILNKLLPTFITLISMREVFSLAKKVRNS